MKPATAILIGAGDRGLVYSSYALRHPDKLRIVAVAEPVEERRLRIAALHRIPSSGAFSSWEELLSKPLMADGAVIATQDAMHVEPAVAAMRRGYHVLLEKPMANTEEDCRTIAESARQTGMTLNICHVLRYTGFFRKVKALIEQGALGDVISIFHAENVSYYHMAHSFVRGNWRRIGDSSPMILAKCCHDMDLVYWFAGSEPCRLSSFGSLSHFIPESAPPGAPRRCTDGCPAEKTCPYYSADTYLHGVPLKRNLVLADSISVSLAARFVLRFPRLAKAVPVIGRYVYWKEWPTTVITRDTSPAGVMRALREGPYGRCVYHCDNDQVDHQETAIEFKNKITACLRMHGHSHEEGRTIRIEGSKATLRGKFSGGGRLEVCVHGTGKRIRVPVKTDLIGHSEGDEGIMENFVTVLRGGKGLTTAEDSLVSHLMAFAAHRARIGRRVVEIDEIR
jgi:predicted dehydrogenase